MMECVASAVLFGSWGLTVGSRLSSTCPLGGMEIAVTGIYAVSKNSENLCGSSIGYVLLPRRSPTHLVPTSAETKYFLAQSKLMATNSSPYHAHP